MALERNFGWDSLKGFLILTVILGHVVPEPLDDSLLRTIIYSFHMPLFIFLSGFLFPLDRALDMSLRGLLNQYKNRVILPWIIAVVVFCGLSIYVYDSHQNPLVVLARHFVKPYFHLWFVPSLLLWMALTRFLFKNVKSSAKRLWWVVFVSFLSYGLSHWVDFDELPSYYSPLDGFQSIYRLQYWIFFIWGVFLRQNLQWLSPIKGMRWIYPAYFLFVIGNFYWNHWSIEWMFFFVANVLLLFQVAVDVYQYKGQGVRVLNWLGVESMGIYLWHYACTMLIKFWVGTENMLHYYAWNIVGLGITFSLLYLFTKNKWTHQIMMGVLMKR
jgi:fucose 4-O-acetylase-like acetyltransferase